MKINTVSTAGGLCSDIVKCSSKDLIDLYPDRVYMIGNVETDQTILDAFATRIGPGEALYWQPVELHPEVQR